MNEYSNCHRRKQQQGSLQLYVMRKSECTDDSKNAVSRTLKAYNMPALRLLLKSLFIYVFWGQSRSEELLASIMLQKISI